MQISFEDRAAFERAALRAAAAGAIVGAVGACAAMVIAQLSWSLRGSLVQLAQGAAASGVGGPWVALLAALLVLSLARARAQRARAAGAPPPSLASLAAAVVLAVGAGAFASLSLPPLGGLLHSAMRAAGMPLVPSALFAAAAIGATFALWSVAAAVPLHLALGAAPGEGAHRAAAPSPMPSLEEELAQQAAELNARAAELQARGAELQARAAELERVRSSLARGEVESRTPKLPRVRTNPVGAK